VAASKPEKETIMNDNTGKETPDFIAYTVRSQNAGPHYTRIGVGFHLKNGGISVLYDAAPLSGQIVLLASAPTRSPRRSATAAPPGNPAST